MNFANSAVSTKMVFVKFVKISEIHAYYLSINVETEE